MELFSVNSDKPTHKYLGELLHYVTIDQSLTVDNKKRFATVSMEKRKDDILLHLYYNENRIIGKRIRKNKPVVIESFRLIDSLCMEIIIGDRL